MQNKQGRSKEAEEPALRRTASSRIGEKVFINASQKHSDINSKKSCFRFWTLDTWELCYLLPIRREGAQYPGLDFTFWRIRGGTQQVYQKLKKIQQNCVFLYFCKIVIHTMMRAFRWRSSAAGLSSHSRQSPTNSSPGRGRGAKVLVPWSLNSGRNRWIKSGLLFGVCCSGWPPFHQPLVRCPRTRRRQRLS